MSLRSFAFLFVLCLVTSPMISQQYIGSFKSNLAGNSLSENRDLIEVNLGQVLSVQEIYNGINNYTSLLRFLPNSGQVNQHLCYAASGAYFDIKTAKVFYIGGTYLLIGHVTEPNLYLNRLMAFKISATNGAILWSFVYDAKELEQWSVTVPDACMDKAGNVWILAEACTNTAAPDHELMLVKLQSTTGLVQMTKVLNYPSTDLRGAEIKWNEQLGLIVSGYVEKTSARQSFGLYLDFDANAQIENAKQLQLFSGSSLLNIYKYTIDMAGNDIYHAVQGGFANNYQAGMFVIAKTDNQWNVTLSRKFGNNLFQLRSATLRYPKYLLSGTTYKTGQQNGFVHIALDAGLQVLQSVNYFNIQQTGNVQDIQSLLLKDGSAFSVAQPYLNDGNMYSIKTNNQLRTMCEDRDYNLFSGNVQILAKDIKLDESLINLNRAKIKIDNIKCSVDQKQVCVPPVVTNCLHGNQFNSLNGGGEKISGRSHANQWQKISADFKSARIIEMQGRIGNSYNDYMAFNSELEQLKSGVYIIEATLQTGEKIVLKHMVFR